MPPLRVYLDSSDYSVLSDERRMNSQMRGILTELRQLKERGLIKFYFSGTLLSEMAPLQPIYTDAAIRRAELMIELCGRNAMFSQDRIFSAELRRAIGKSCEPIVPVSAVGEWYPEGIAGISPVTEIEMSSQITQVISEAGLNRKGRRAAKRRAFKGEQPRAALIKALIANAKSASLDEILESFPMRTEDARTLGRFSVGDATQAEAAAAFEESLRDPRWMMLWFEKHHSQLTPFIEWTRSPAVRMIRSLSEMSDLSALIRQRDAVHGTNIADSVISVEIWDALQEKMLSNVAARLCEDLIGRGTSRDLPLVIDHACPGLSVSIRSLHSSAWSVTGQTPRRPKLSDFPDAMHAVYAPYVDIFRADSFMAPYILKETSRHGTKVVSKLLELPGAIAARLSESSQCPVCQ